MLNSKPPDNLDLRSAGPGTEDRAFAFWMTVAASLLLFLYVLGAVFPASGLWGVHHFAFIPVTAMVLIAAVLLCSLFPFFSRGVVSFLEKSAASVPPFRTVHGVVLLCVAITGGFIFYANRIAIDWYGDARTLLSTRSSSTYTLTSILGFQDYEPLTRYIHQSVALILHLGRGPTYQLVSSAAGGIFLALYLWYVATSNGSPLWRLFILISGLLCGANQLFFGYVEDYALVYICMIAFLILAWKAFEGKNTLPWVLISFIIGVKLHLQMILFGPSVVYLILFRLSGRKESFGAWITLRKILFAVVASLFLCAYLYFIVFNASRLEAGGKLNETRRIFLPLVNDVYPPHDYSLLSWTHGSDMLQVLLLAISPGIVILLAAALAVRRSVRWTSPRTLFYGVAVFYFLLFDYTINTMLTPMRDWDMLSLITPAVLFFGNSVAHQLFEKFQQHAVLRKIVGVSLAFGIIPLLFIFVNSRQEIAGNRLRSLGLWSFKSYYYGSAYILDAGCLLIPDKNREIAERERILQIIEPDTAPTDEEVSRFTYRLGVVLQDEGEYSRAEQYYRQSLAQDSGNVSALKGLSVVFLFQWKFEEAAQLIEQYNSSINVAKVIDFQSLLIAHYTHRCLYLVRQHAEKSVISEVLAEAQHCVSAP